MLSVSISNSNSTTNLKEKKLLHVHACMTVHMISTEGEKNDSAQKV